MSSLIQKIQSSGNQFSPQVDEGINKLPSEVLNKIFSYLLLNDKKMTALVNRRWNRETINTIKTEQLGIIISFISFVKENLDPNLFKDEINSISNLPGLDMRFSRVKGVKNVNFSILKLRDEMLTALKKLQSADIDQMKNKCENNAEFKKLLDQLRIYTYSEKIILKLEEQSLSLVAPAQHFGENKVEVLFNAASNSVDNGNIDEALSIIIFNIGYFIEVDKEKYQSLIKNILVYLLKTGAHPRAQKIVEFLLNKELRNQAIISITDDLAKGGAYDEAITFARNIRDRHPKDYALLRIVDYSVTSGAREIPEKLLEELHFRDKISLECFDTSKSMLATLLINLAGECRYDEALEMINQIPDIDQREQEVITLLNVLADRGNIEGVEFYAKSIFCTQMSSNALDAICTIFLNVLNVDRFEAIVRSIENERLKQVALCRMSLTLARQSRLVDAFKILDEKTRLSHVKEIVESLDRTEVLKTDYIKTAEFHSYSPSLKESILCCMALIHAKSGDFEKVHEHLQLVRSSDDLFLEVYKVCFKNCTLQNSIEYSKKIWGPIKHLVNFFIACRAAEENELEIAADLLNSLSFNNFGSLICMHFPVILSRLDRVQYGIDLAKNLNDSDRSYFLSEFSKYLSQIDNVSTSIKVANLIDNTRDKENAFCFALNHLIQQGSIDNAVKLFFSINSSDAMLSKNMRGVCRSFIKHYLDNNNVEGAIKIAEKINDQLSKGEFLHLVSLKLTERGKVDEAIDIVRSMPDGRIKWSATKAICIHIILQLQDIDRAIDIIPSSLLSYESREFIVDICRTLALKSKLDLALEFAKKVKNQDTRDEALSFISYQVLLRGDVERAQKLVDTLSSKILKKITQSKMDHFKLINKIEELLRCGNLDAAKACPTKSDAQTHLHYCENFLKGKNILLDVFQMKNPQLYLVTELLMPYDINYQ